MPSPEAPLAGSCACGTVRFQVTAAFTTAGFCHCTRCQRRSGAMWTLNGSVDDGGFELLEGGDAIRTWQPPDGGLPKSFCVHCGGHLYSGERGSGGIVGVRFGALHGDPEIAPRWRQWLESAPAWAAIPDDGLPRFAQRREID